MDSQKRKSAPGQEGARFEKTEYLDDPGESGHGVKRGIEALFDAIGAGLYSTLTRPGYGLRFAIHEAETSVRFLIFGRWRGATPTWWSITEPKTPAGLARGCELLCELRAAVGIAYVENGGGE